MTVESKTRIDKDSEDRTVKQRLSVGNTWGGIGVFILQAVHLSYDVMNGTTTTSYVN